MNVGNDQRQLVVYVNLDAVTRSQSDLDRRWCACHSGAEAEGNHGRQCEADGELGGSGKGQKAHSYAGPSVRAKARGHEQTTGHCHG